MAFLSIFVGIAAIVYSLAQNQARARAFAAYRGGLVPVNCHAAFDCRGWCGDPDITRCTRQ